MSRYHLQLNTRRWQDTRAAVLVRDIHICQICGYPAYPAEIDHVTPLHVDPEQDPYDPAGCQTLCIPCHREKTRKELGHAAPVPGRAAWDDFVNQLSTERKNT